MTTQTCRATLFGGSKALNFTATCTDDQWNELKDSVFTLSLYEVMQGETITALRGSYAAGGAQLRIRNTQSNQVKVIECLPMTKGEYVRPLTRPVQIQMYDVVEVFSTIAGS